jgi:alpha-1,2-mannosyltransferase
MAVERLRLPHLAGTFRLQGASWLTWAHTSRLHLPALLLLALLLLVAAYQLLAPPTVAVGPLDRRFISDTNAREFIPDLGREVRWTQEESHLRLPLVAADTPLRLDLLLANSYPPNLGLPPPTVDIEVQGEWLTRLYVEQSFAGPRRYQLVLPPQQPAGWALPLTLFSSTITLPEDPRPIGVMLAEAQLSPLDGRPLLPPLWQLFAGLLFAAMGYFSLRGLGAGRNLAWALAAALTLALALGLAFWHLHVAPYTMRLAGLLSLGALYGLAALLLREPAAPASTLAAPRISLARMVLIFGLAYWLMPVYQLIMTADSAQAVTPYPPTFWVGAVVLASGIIGAGVLADMGRGGAWQAWLLVVVGAAAVVHLAILIDFALGRSGPDFWILFRGARDWVRGGSMYNLEAIRENHFGHVFKVPPFYGMLFVPFAQQDGLMILYWHRIINVVLLLSTLLLLGWAYHARIPSALGVGLLVLFNMRPATDTIAFGQIDILLLLLLVLTLLAAQRGRNSVAGALLALATLFKLYPALLLVFFIVKRRWWALAGFAGAMLVLNGISIALVGWQLHQTYLLDVLPRIGGTTTWVENQTISGFVSRMVAGDIDAAIFYHPLVSLVTYGSFLLALGGAVLLARRPAAPQSPHFMLQYGSFIIVMILTAPAAWMHYQTIMIVPFFALLLYSAAHHGLPHWRAALLGLAWGLIAYGNQWSFFDGSIMGHLTFLGVSYKLYGLLLLAAVTVACLRDAAPEQRRLI